MNQSTQAKIVIGPLRFPLHSLDSKVDGNKLWIDSRLDSSTRSKTLDMLSRAHQGIVDYFCTPLFHQRCNIVILAGSHFFVECCPGLIICAEPLSPNEHEDECVDWQKMMKTYYSMLCDYFSFLWKFSAREAWFQDCLCAFLALHLIRHNSDVDDYEKFTYRHICVEFEPVDYASPLFAKGLVFFQKAADLNPMALRDALALAVRVYGGQSTTIEEITSLVEKECLLGVNDTITNTWRHSWNAPHFQQSAEFDRGLQFDSFIGRQVENNLEMGKTKWHPSDCPNVQNQRINLLDPTCAIVSTPTMPSKCRVENCPQSKTSVSSESSSDEDIADDDSYQTKPRHRLHRAVPIASLSEEQNETIDPVMSGDYEDYSLDVDSAQLTNQRMTPSVPLLGQSFKPYETRTTQRVRFASDDFQSTKTTKQSSQRNENVFDIAEYATKSEDKKHPDESISVPIAKPALDFYDRISDPQPHFQLDGRHSSIIQASTNPLFRPYRADLPNPKSTQTPSLSMSASIDHTRENDIEIGMKPHHEKALNFPITSHGRPTMLSNHYMASSKSPSRINRLVESHLNRYPTHPSLQYPHLQGKKQNQWLQMSSLSIQIHHLAARGNIEASIEALHHGASLACVDENGRNAIHHATISAHSVWIETILSMRFVQHDLQKIINMTDRRGWTPMDYAAHYESIELIGERKQAYGDIMVFFRDLISKQSASDHHPYGAACSGTNIVPLHISRERLFDRIMQPSFPQGSSPKTDESYREFEGTKAKKVVGAPDYLLKGDEKGEAKISKRLYSQLKHNQSQRSYPNKQISDVE
eukprot:TRINITY_DN6077_c0_g1_i3.p1 TRINITY_DN6077_c0_g1~~TRINITY_DN6077_c0_g1_i3.p1  ORF type:complete len:812 (+),score=120.00 TRINITY_DN6077_c0_g1_i3:807-3242(+)